VFTKKKDVTKDIQINLWIACFFLSHIIYTTPHIYVFVFRMEYGFRTEYGRVTLSLTLCKQSMAITW